MQERIFWCQFHLPAVIKCPLSWAKRNNFGFDTLSSQGDSIHTTSCYTNDLGTFNRNEEIGACSSETTRNLPPLHVLSHKEFWFYTPNVLETCCFQQTIGGLSHGLPLTGRKIHDHNHHNLLLEVHSSYAQIMKVRRLWGCLLMIFRACLLLTGHIFGCAFSTVWAVSCF